MNASSRLKEIDVDIAEAERLMTALRLTIAVKGSIGEETIADDRRLLKMMLGWMLLQDRRLPLVRQDARGSIGLLTYGTVFSHGLIGGHRIVLRKLSVDGPLPPVADNHRSGKHQQQSQNKKAN